MKIIKQSPILKKKKLMTFPEAIAQLAVGKKITKLEWKDKKIYGVLRKGVVMIHRKEFHRWIINEGDLMSNDWIIV